MSKPTHVSENEALRKVLARLLSQANEVGKYSSWAGMCEYNETADAREEAREILGPPKPFTE